MYRQKLTECGVVRNRRPKCIQRNEQKASKSISMTRVELRTAVRSLSPAHVASIHPRRLIPGPLGGHKAPLLGSTDTRVSALRPKLHDRSNRARKPCTNRSTSGPLSPGPLIQSKFSAIDGSYGRARNRHIGISAPAALRAGRVGRGSGGGADGPGEDQGVCRAQTRIEARTDSHTPTASPSKAAM